MSYTKQTWDTTSYVTPTRMNHIEDGIKDSSDRLDNLSANDVAYDSNTTVKQKIDAVASKTTIKKTTDASIAFSQAQEYVILVGSGTKGNVNISLSIYIPVSSRTSTLTYWETSAAYNTSSQTFLQIAVSDTSVRDIGLYDGASLISDATYTYYYR